MSTTAVDANEAAARFREDGYLILRNAVDPAELRLLQEETLAQIEAGPHREPRGDFYTKPSPGGDDTFFRVQFLTSKALRNDSMLLAIAHPQVLGITAELLGPSWTTYGSAMVFKGTDGGAAIELHRDFPLKIADETQWNAGHLCYNVDIYLDSATPESGCLRILPGSHKLTDVAEVRALLERGLDNPDLVDVPMEPGDILFHDVLLIHGSDPTPPGRPLRRVLYYSYQSADLMETEGVLPGFPVPRRWLAQHIKLMAHAIDLRRHADHLGGEAQFDYDVPEAWADDAAAEELELRPRAGGLPWEREVLSA